MPPVELCDSFLGNTGGSEPLRQTERDEEVDGLRMVLPQVDDGVVVEVVVWGSSAQAATGDQSGVMTYNGHARYTGRELEAVRRPCTADRGIWPARRIAKESTWCQVDDTRTAARLTCTRRLDQTALHSFRLSSSRRLPSTARGPTSLRAQATSRRPHLCPPISAGRPPKAGRSRRSPRRPHEPR